MQRRPFLLASSAALLGTLGTAGSARAAAAAGPRHYAVLSLVGASIDVVTFVFQTGSAIDTNRHQPTPVPQAGFDRIAGRALLEGIKRLDPTAKSDLLEAELPELRNHQADLFIDGSLRLPKEDAADIASGGTTHLLLVTEASNEIRVPEASGHSGKGKVKGLGLYIDRVTPVHWEEERTDSVGYLAPYAYLRVSLVDTATWKVLASDLVMDVRPFPALDPAQHDDPWLALTPEAKISTLGDMLKQAVDQAMPKVLAPVLQG